MRLIICAGIAGGLGLSCLPWTPPEGAGVLVGLLSGAAGVLGIIGLAAVADRATPEAALEGMRSDGAAAHASSTASATAAPLVAAHPMAPPRMHDREIPVAGAPSGYPYELYDTTGRVYGRAHGHVHGSIHHESIHAGATGVEPASEGAVAPMASPRSRARHVLLHQPCGDSPPVRTRMRYAQLTVYDVDVPPGAPAWDLIPLPMGGVEQ